MKTLLMKKRQKLTPRASGQTLLSIPVDLKQDVTTDKEMIVTYEKENGKLIITLEEV